MQLLILVLTVCSCLLSIIRPLQKSIIDEVKLVDYAFIDGTFYNGSELNRDMKEIPHPSIEETLQLFLILMRGKQHLLKNCSFMEELYNKREQ